MDPLKILGPILGPVIKMILVPLKKIQSLPKMLFKKFMKWLKKIIFSSETSVTDYVLLGERYYSKRFLVIMTLVTFLLVYFLFIKPPDVVLKYTFRDIKLIENTEKALTFNGIALLYDLNKQLKYEGGFQGGAFHGNGKLYHPNGKIKYDGEFNAGAMMGQGTMYDEEGNLVYKGAFVDNQFGGAGMFFEQGSLVYEGMFQLGQFAGSGKRYDLNGKLQYSGEFLADRYEGKGQLFRPDGTLWYDGNFVNGLLSGEGKELFPNGNPKFVGQFKEGNYSGSGSLFSENGKKYYTGEWIAGAFEGPGELYYPSGLLQFKGNFLTGKYDGLGTLYNSDGTVQVTSFFKGGNVYIQQFLGMTSVALAELLGDPDGDAAGADEAGGSSSATDMTPSGSPDNAGASNADGASSDPSGGTSSPTESILPSATTTPTGGSSPQATPASTENKNESGTDVEEAAQLSDIGKRTAQIQIQSIEPGSALPADAAALESSSSPNPLATADTTTLKYHKHGVSFVLSPHPSGSGDLYVSSVDVWGYQLVQLMHQQMSVNQSTFDPVLAVAYTPRTVELSPLETLEYHQQFPFLVKVYRNKVKNMVTRISTEYIVDPQLINAAAAE